MADIITFTVNPAIDKSTSIIHVSPKKKLRCKKPTYEPGGGGINVSRVIKRLGGTSLTYYTSGGPYGNMLDILLKQKEGLNCFPIKIKDITRENLMVFEEDSGQQYRFGMPGPNLEEAEWKKCIEIIKNITPVPKYIVASGSLPENVPLDFYARIAKTVKSSGSRLIVDTWGQALQMAVEEGVFLIKPNMNELEDLTGKIIENEIHQEEMAKKLISKGKTQSVVLSLGAAGVLLVTREYTRRIRSPIVPIKSRVGAGDSMVAAIVFSLSKGKSLLESVCMGTAAGAAATMTPGTELCRKEDTLRLYNQLVKENC